MKNNVNGVNALKNIKNAGLSKQNVIYNFGQAMLYCFYRNGKVDSVSFRYD